MSGIDNSISLITLYCSKYRTQIIIQFFLEELFALEEIIAKVPDKKDMEYSLGEMHRIEQIYDLEAIELARGRIQGKQYEYRKHFFLLLSIQYDYFLAFVLLFGIVLLWESTNLKGRTTNGLLCGFAWPSNMSPKEMPRLSTAFLEIPRLICILCTPNQCSYSVRRMSQEGLSNLSLTII